MRVRSVVQDLPADSLLYVLMTKKGNEVRDSVIQWEGTVLINSAPVFRVHPGVASSL